MLVCDVRGHHFFSSTYCCKWCLFVTSALLLDHHFFCFCKCIFSRCLPSYKVIFCLSLQRTNGHFCTGHDAQLLFSSGLTDHFSQLAHRDLELSFSVIISARTLNSKVLMYDACPPAGSSFPLHYIVQTGTSLVPRMFNSCGYTDNFSQLV